MITAICSVLLVAIMVAVYYVNDKANRQIKERVDRLQAQRDLATMYCLHIMKQTAISDEDYEAAKKLTEMMEGFTMNNYDITITSNKPYKTPTT